jgi:hypothetical protein
VVKPRAASHLVTGLQAVSVTNEPRANRSSDDLSDFTVISHNEIGLTLKGTKGEL